MEQTEILIVGSGHGGAQAAIALRQAGFEGSVTMVGRDREVPYERPPLSKDYLAGDKPFERILIRPARFWDDKQITLRPGLSVTKIDPMAHQVTLADGAQIGYRHLIWAGGGDPRRLACPGGDLAGVHAIRDRRDVDGLKAELDAGHHKVVVIGGGYIGLEAAAVLTKLGCEVTLLEALPRVLARVAGEELSEFYQNEHRSHGVDVRLEAMVDRLEGETRVERVVLADGEQIACDLVVVGIGIVPSTGPLIAAGAAGANGIDVDRFCRTSLESVYAIGDCAAHASEWAGGAVIRLESVQNANDMATTVAKHICGEEVPYTAFPWFWSNQYDLKLQTAGLSLDYDATVLRGDPQERKFSVIYLREGRVIALDCVNSVKDYVQGRKLIELGSQPDPEQLADTETPLKELM